MSELPTEFDTGLTRPDLESKNSRFVQAPWGEFALYLDGEEVFCLEAFCPHMQGPLFEGSVADGIVSCPWHEWRFRLSDGCRVDCEDPENPVKHCKVEVSPRGTYILQAPQS